MPSAQVFAVSNILYPELLNGKRLMFTAFSKNGVSDAGGGILVLGVSGVRIRVHAFFAAATSATSQFAIWRNTTTIFQAPFAANGQITLPFSPVGWIQGSHGEALNLWTDAAAVVTGVCVYAEVD